MVTQDTETRSAHTKMLDPGMKGGQMMHNKSNSNRQIPTIPSRRTFS